MCYSVMIEQDLKKIAQLLSANINTPAFIDLERKRQKTPKAVKVASGEGRIYPNTWSPIAVHQEERTIIVPMRYRIRPRGSTQEVPSKFNMYNCRLDSLETKKTWRTLFMRQHGIIVLRGFYEWVQDENTGRKKVVFFSPREQDHVFAPVLWDSCEIRNSQESSAGKDVLTSFAIVTRDPSAEISAAGHDRSPAFLDQEAAQKWLRPAENSQAEIYKLLNDGIKPYFMVSAANA